ncbi:glycine betaine ABC transporter substrate-binding protein [Anaerostipes sp.]|uniref:glycine betaine ABC transporter substrate-binding protein n=1 Tax=Anaerostipes sp. TaxID=1872530 RepID=UPI002F4288B4
MRARGRRAKKVNRNLLLLTLLAAAALAAGTFFGQAKKDTIHIATKPMTEQYVLGEMLCLLIEQDTGLNAELTQGVGGGTSNIQPAMEKGEFDIYPEYTGTGWNMVLKKSSLYTEDMFGQLKAGYEDKCGMTATTLCARPTG